MSNRERGEVGLPLGGVIYTMALEFETMVKIEELLGKGVFELFTHAANGTFTTIQLATIIHCAVIVEDEEDRPSLSQVGALILAEGVSNLITPIGLFFTMAVNGGQQPAKKKRAPAKKKK